MNKCWFSHTRYRAQNQLDLVRPLPKERTRSEPNKTEETLLAFKCHPCYHLGSFESSRFFWFNNILQRHRLSLSEGRIKGLYSFIPRCRPSCSFPRLRRFKQHGKRSKLLFRIALISYNNPFSVSSAGSFGFLPSSAF